MTELEIVLRVHKCLCACVCARMCASVSWLAYVCDCQMNFTVCCDDIKCVGLLVSQESEVSQRFAEKWFIRTVTPV